MVAVISNTTKTGRDGYLLTLCQSNLTIYIGNTVTRWRSLRELHAIGDGCIDFELRSEIENRQERVHRSPPGRQILTGRGFIATADRDGMPQFVEAD